MLARSIGRNIRRTAGRFLSIAMIIALGVAFFVGIRSIPTDMEQTAAAYYDATRLMDYRIVSTFGFNETDIAALREATGDGGSPAYAYDVLAGEPGAQKVVKLQSFERRGVNLPVLLEGRWPENAGECLIDPTLAGDYPAGSTLAVRAGGEDELSDALYRDSFTIVGVARTPLYISRERGNSAIGNGSVSGYALLIPEAFALPYPTDYYLRFSPEGGSALVWSGLDAEAAETALAELGEWCAEERLIELQAEADASLSGYREDIAEARARADSEAGEAQGRIDEARAGIDQARAQLADSQVRLATELAEAQAQLDEAYPKLESTRKSLNRANDKFKADQAKITTAKTAAKGNKDALAAADKLQAEWDKERAAYNVQLRRYREERAEYDAAVAELEARKAEAETEIAEATARVDEGEAELALRQAELDEARAKADADIAEAQAKLDDAQARLDVLDPPEWYILGRESNPGLASYQQDAERIGAIGRVFPWIFFLVAMLVCLTTITRMVEERRLEIGTLKALGYGSASIALIYLAYAVLAGALGVAAGIPVGVSLLPEVVFSAYSILYSLPPLIRVAHLPSIVTASAMALAVVGGTALFACRRALAAQPAALMRPKAPPPGKRIFLERWRRLWSRLSFSQKVTARNLLRYKARFLMTVIGVAGCTALLLAGFGIKNSIDALFTLQFGGVMHYDAQMTLEEEKVSEISAALAAHPSVDSHILMRQTSMEAYSGKEGSLAMENVLVVVPQDPTRLGDYITLRDRRTGAGFAGFERGALDAPTLADQSRAVITEKLAKLLDISVGDLIVLQDEDNRRVSVFVSGIAENYALHYVYLTPDAYETAFGVRAEPNVALLNSTLLSDAGPLSEELLRLDGARSISFVSRVRDSFHDTLKNLDPIVWVLIGAAAALALVVLLNLTHINILERRRELATLRVLGFYDRETRAYIHRESAIMTALGIAAGLVLGIFLHRYVMATAEVNLVMFGREIFPASYGYAAALSALFAVAVNLLMIPKLRAIDMVESLKGVE